MDINEVYNILKNDNNEIQCVIEPVYKKDMTETILKDLGWTRSKLKRVIKELKSKGVLVKPSTI